MSLVSDVITKNDLVSFKMFGAVIEKVGNGYYHHTRNMVKKFCDDNGKEFNEEEFKESFTEAMTIKLSHAGIDFEFHVVYS